MHTNALRGFKTGWLLTCATFGLCFPLKSGFRGLQRLWGYYPPFGVLHSPTSTSHQNLWQVTSMWFSIYLRISDCQYFSHKSTRDVKNAICISLQNVLSLHCRKGGVTQTGNTSFLSAWLSVYNFWVLSKKTPVLAKIIRHIVKNRCRIIFFMCRIIFCRSVGVLNFLNKS